MLILRHLCSRIQILCLLTPRHQLIDSDEVVGAVDGSRRSTAERFVADVLADSEALVDADSDALVDASTRYADQTSEAAHEKRIKTTEA